MGQDFWDSRKWQREFESKQVNSLVLPLFYFQIIAKHNVLWLSSEQTSS